MKPSVDRRQLENVLLGCWEEHEKSRADFEALDDYLYRNYKIPLNLTTDILSLARPIDLISAELLCALAMGTFKVFDCAAANPAKYFTDIEIDAVSNMTFEQDESLDGDLKLSNVLCVRKDHYVTVISSQLLNKLLDSGRVVYRPETQRGSVVRRVGDAIIRKIRINHNSVKHITEMIIKRQYEPTMLTINVLSDDPDSCVYNSRNRTLYIKEGVEVNMTDGLHRTYGTIKALISNPDIDQPWILCITRWPISRVKTYIRQEDYKTPLPPEVRASMDQYDIATQIVTALNEAMQNEMQGRIATDTRSVAEGVAYTLFSVMLDGVRNGFKPKFQKDVSTITAYLVKFYNDLIPLIKSRDDLTHYGLFYGYTLLAARCYNGDTPFELLGGIVGRLHTNPLSRSGRNIKTLTLKEQQTVKEWIDNAL